jgi:endonuclease YncB( thermonuclease family)
MRAYPTVLLALLLLWSSTTLAQEWQARVVGVSDGDTLTVAYERASVKIRLQGVDSPETKQPFGERAKQFASTLLLGKSVTVKPVTQDGYGRVVAEVLVPQTEVVEIHRGAQIEERKVRVLTDAGEELVKAGLAWWYRPHAPRGTRLAELEADAKRAKRGLWADPNPTPPWEWRRGHRGGKLPPGEANGTPIREADRITALEETHPVAVDVRSKTFHWFTCPQARGRRCKATFDTVEQAKAAGYQPHAACTTRTEAGADACYTECLKRSRPRAVAWEAIQAECRQACRTP